MQRHDAAARGAGVGGVRKGSENPRNGESRRTELSLVQSLLSVDVRLKVRTDVC
jgi:hypothetical protein